MGRSPGRGGIGVGGTRSGVLGPGCWAIGGPAGTARTPPVFS